MVDVKKKEELIKLILEEKFVVVEVEVDVLVKKGLKVFDEFEKFDQK